LTYSKDRWIRAYSIGLTIPGKLSRPNNDNNDKKIFEHYTAARPSKIFKKHLNKFSSSIQK
jgi:hypothetical protein